MIKGAFFLSLAALFAKILSAFYRIPFQNMAGDMGFYVYQQVYPFYGVITILALYGFPVVLSRQVAEKKAHGKQEEANELVLYSFLGIFLFSLIVCVGFLFFARHIAVLIGDESLEPLMRVVGIGFLFLPLLSTLRGVGQGNEEMEPSAFSHVGEQFMRVFAILIITYLLVDYHANPYEIGIGALYGSLIGSVIGCVILTVMTKGKLATIRNWKLSVRSFFYHNLNLFKQSIFICLNALVLLLFQLVDVFTIVRLLQSVGVVEEQAFLTKGIYDRGQPLLQLGTILTTTVALALVPLLSKSIALNKIRDAQMYRDVSMRMAVLIGGGATLLILLMEPINHMLFTDGSGTFVLQVLAFSIFPCTVYLAGAAILQGYGKIHIPFYAISIGVFVKLGGNILFVPFFETTLGAAIANVLAFTVMMGIVLYAIKAQGEIIVVQKRSFMVVIITLLVMGMSVFIVKQFILAPIFPQTRMGSSLLALLLSTFGGLIVALSLLVTNLLTKREWASMPKLLKVRRKMIRFITRV
ncbi:LOW QUALITY PROTEIN: stage V sporulation protein B [Bacillus sp. JCM 19046]|nr:LOW QUALITY PROTEIN: stage V sporulation protein B [Bacillus sp. JCM 19046]